METEPEPLTQSEEDGEVVQLQKKAKMRKVYGLKHHPYGQVARFVCAVLHKCLPKRLHGTFTRHLFKSKHPYLLLEEG